MSDESPTGQGVLPRYLAALSYADFRTLWIANISSGAAAWALIVARGWLVYEMSESSMWVGLVTFAAMIPRVIVTPLSGYLSDRFDRRSVLSAMFAVNLVHSVFLAGLAFSGNIEIWHLVVLSLVNGSARATQMPAAQALIPNLVPRKLLLNAVALNQASMQGSRLIGPASIVPLLALSGPEGAFALCTVFYGVSLVQSLRVKTASTGEIDKSQSFFRNLSAGAVFVYQTPTMRAIILLALFHCGLTMSFESLLPVLSRQQLNAEGAGFSYLMMAIGGGALVSSMFLAGVRSSVTRGRMFLYLGILSGIAPILLAFSTNVPMALAGAAAMGVAQSGFMTLTHTMIQTIAPDWIRGRLGGIYSVHVGGTMALVNLVNGGMADHINAPLLLIVGGVAFVAIMILSRYYFSLRQIYSKGVPVPVAVAGD